MSRINSLTEVSYRNNNKKFKNPLNIQIQNSDDKMPKFLNSLVQLWPTIDRGFKQDPISEVYIFVLFPETQFYCDIFRLFRKVPCRSISPSYQITLLTIIINNPEGFNLKKVWTVQSSFCKLLCQEMHCLKQIVQTFSSLQSSL